jgi:hypothetical protein
MDHRLAMADACVCSRLVSHRFQIQDIVAQDELGVLFRAIDTERDCLVGLRRFFPFGQEGGGLVDHERTEYERGVAVMATLNHPALRSVICGGCDPVDGIPYLVTEWIDGTLLTTLLEERDFEPEAAIELLDRAMELCEAISAKLGVEAMWLETTAAMVVLDGAADGRGFTFGLSPIRWLVETGDRRSLMPLVGLTEDLMGWRGRLIGDQTGGGLGGWLKWLRGNAQTASVTEARRMLANFTGDPAVAAENLATLKVAVPTQRTGGGVTQPLRRDSEVPVTAISPLPSGSLKRQLIVIGVLICLVALAGWWAVNRPRGSQETAAAIPQDAEDRRIAEVNALAAKLDKESGEAAGRELGPPFQVTDSLALLNERGKEVVVEGVLKRLRKTKATLFLEFSEEPDAGEIRGCIALKDAGPELSEEQLKPLIGKRIQLTGIVRLAPLAKTTRPEVVLKDRESIKEVP